MKLSRYLKSIKITQKAFADRVGVSQGMVHQWAKEISRVSGEKVRVVSKATNWQVTPHDLRPDIYPNPTDGLPSGAEPQPVAAGAE